MVHYAIVGFGNAGYHAARAIRARDPQGEIHILSDQTFPPANPMLTTYYVKGALDWPGLFPYGSLEELSRSMKLHLHMGRRSVGTSCAAGTGACRRRANRIWAVPYLYRRFRLSAAG